MLASILLFGCLVAGAVSVGILLLVVGPVRVRRKVTLVSRGSVTPQPATGAPLLAGLSAHAELAEPRFAHQFVQVPLAHADTQPQSAQPAIEPVAPVKLRRPRTEQLRIRRERMARGTPAPRVADLERTDEHAIPFFDADADEMTMPDAARRTH